MGIANDYMLEAAQKARVVIAEFNALAPWTYGDELLVRTKIDYVVRTSRPLPEFNADAPSDVERRIAAHAAPFIPDGAIIESGIGATPDAILSALLGHRRLGIHSGMMSDSMLALIEAGAVDNSSKPIDTGVSIVGALYGTERLYRYAHKNKSLRLCPVTYTHSAAVMANYDVFVAINSATEVDLTGQVNAEVSNAAYVGAVGGQGDFIRAANNSLQGRSIIALPSTAKNGTVTRITARLSDNVTTTPRSDADLIVTEWGVAELRGTSIQERVRRMIPIAHPTFREQLEREARDIIGNKLS